MNVPPPTDPRTRLRASLLITIGLVAAVYVAFIMLFGGTSTPLLLPGLLAIGIVIAGGAMLINMVARQQTAPAKDKRSFSDLDMYSLINRLVDDLDEDELAYLERKLDERRRYTDNRLTEDIGLLLEHRDEERQAGKRA
ncbi:MAG: hypothetical protein KJ065_06485 [Anaerolineae bacterium]|nr:hypothetical protein [Anaerolineae bacterium]